MTCSFFSSRRRHTRYIGDWSSDVCSSDLVRPPCQPSSVQDRTPSPRVSRCQWQSAVARPTRTHQTADRRSEERRVGNECRGGGAADRNEKFVEWGGVRVLEDV